eukprot:SAG11_NODE_77_length_17985_cov_25.875657_12_plen_224_part_00
MSASAPSTASQFTSYTVVCHGVGGASWTVRKRYRELDALRSVPPPRGGALAAAPPCGGAAQSSPLLPDPPPFAPFSPTSFPTPLLLLFHLLSQSPLPPPLPLPARAVPHTAEPVFGGGHRADVGSAAVGGAARSWSRSRSTPARCSSCPSRPRPGGSRAGATSSTRRRSRSAAACSKAGLTTWCAACPQAGVGLHSAELSSSPPRPRAAEGMAQPRAPPGRTG